MRDLWLTNHTWGRSGPLWAARLKSSISGKQKARSGTRSGTRRQNGEIVSRGGSGSSLYRTLVAEVTFHRPCAPEECAWGALWPSQNSFARTCVVNTILACTLGLDSQLGAPCSGASGFEFVSHLCDRSHFLSTLCGPNSSQETSGGSL